MSWSFRDEDRGYRDLVKRVFEFAKPVVTIGIHEKAGQADLINGKKLIDVANINEFGTDDGHVPARSFIRAWFDGAEGELRRRLVGLMQQVVAGKLSKEQALDTVGQLGVGGVQERIAAHIPPPNAPETIRRKGSSTPLIDTGFLRSSVTYEVDPGEGGET